MNNIINILFFILKDAHPVRLKKIYIVHTASFINQVMALVKPLIKSELLQLIKFSTGGPGDFFPSELLPEVNYLLLYFLQKLPYEVLIFFVKYMRHLNI